MKKIFLLPFIVFGLSACNNGGSLPSTYLSSNIRLYEPSTNASGDPSQAQKLNATFNTLRMSKSQALQSLAAMQNSFRSSYIGYKLKKDLIGKSGDQIFAECRQRLNQYPDKLSTFDYYDFMQECIAIFRDSHLELSKTTTPSTVTSVIASAKLIQGKLYIYEIRANLINKFEELKKLPKNSIKEKLLPGLEIVSINDHSPLQEINQLKKYSAEAADKTIENVTVENIFTRNFFYPDKNELKLVVKQPDASLYEIEVPWIQFTDKDGGDGSIESKVILTDRNIIPSGDLSVDDEFLLEFGKKENTIPQIYGSLFSEIQNLKMYKKIGGNTVLLTGFVNIDNDRYCYIKLKSFSLPISGGKENLVSESKTKVEQSIVDVLQNYLADCDFSGKPLIFDLRQNGGGSADLADQIYNLFETPTTPISYSASAYLINRGNSNALNLLLNGLKKPVQSLQSTLALKSLDNEKTQGDWILERQIKNTRNVFTGKVALLISSNCYSACESTANRFKKTNRAILVGEPTGGTGFGFMGGSTYSDIHQSFSIKILNMAFQSAVVSDDKDFSSDADTKGSVKKFSELPLLENHPVQPDFTIVPTYNDIFNNSADYLKSLNEILKN
jgi:hypothetical protein